MGLAEAPVYFVSSNLHSLVNVLSGVSRRLEAEIIEFTKENDRDLYAELEHIESGETHASRDNWLYFAARGFFDSHPKSADFRKVRSQIEREMGIRHIRARPT